jgi:hypothetical protein
MCWTQKFSFSRDPVILDLKLQLANFQEVISSDFWKTKSNKVKLCFKALFKVKQRQSDIPIYNLPEDPEFSTGGTHLF